MLLESGNLSLPASGHLGDFVTQRATCGQDMWHQSLSHTGHMNLQYSIIQSCPVPASSQCSILLLIVGCMESRIKPLDIATCYFLPDHCIVFPWALVSGNTAARALGNPTIGNILIILHRLQISTGAKWVHQDREMQFRVLSPILFGAGIILTSDA